MREEINKIKARLRSIPANMISQYPERVQKLLKADIRNLIDYIEDLENRMANLKYRLERLKE